MAENPSAGFHLIQQQAACAFAPRARIEAVAPFHGADARDAGLAAAGRLADFATRVEADELDGLVIELTDARHGLSIDALGEATRRVLSGLLEAEGASAAEALSNAGAEHWWLTLCGTRWFVLAFAPCYPADSPRFTFGSGSAFLLLQPVASFDRHATPLGTAIADEVRQMIRRAYAAVGCPYDAELAQQDVESLKFVWPLRHGDAPQRWWQSDTGPGRNPDIRAIADHSQLAVEIAATHAASPRATWDAPNELLEAARGLFTSAGDSEQDGADDLLAGIARLLAHGPYSAVRLHSAGSDSPLPTRIRPERQFGPPEEDVLLHAISVATPPGAEPWPHGQPDLKPLAGAIPALTGAVPCRTVVLRAAAVRYLLRTLESVSDRQRRWLLRRVAWLLDPRTDDAGSLLLRLLGPHDPLIAPLNGRVHGANPSECSEPFPLSGWMAWQTDDDVLRLGGRIAALRKHRRLSFADLRWEDRTAQLAIEPDLAPELRAGDLVAVRGHRGTSRAGQPTVFVTHLEQHQPGVLRPAPEATAVSGTLRATRDHLAAARFAEVITSVLTDGYFGGRARPFGVWAAAADRRQYLRVTTELALLDVIASGTSRCYEIGPSFRNEGLRGQPAKEFLMLEAYAADLDLAGMTEYAVALIRSVTAHREPLRRLTFDDAFRELSSVDPSDVPAIQALAAEQIPITAARTDDPDLLARRLWRSSVRQRMQGVTAIESIPGPGSPLIAGTGRAAQRIWLYVDGLEVAEVSCNERDPRVLADAFERQFAQDPHHVHRDYRQVISMFESGVPPCVGIGLSVTRLASLARRNAVTPAVPSPRQEESR